MGRVGGQRESTGGPWVSSGQSLDLSPVSSSVAGRGPGGESTAKAAYVDALLGPALQLGESAWRGYSPACGPVTLFPLTPGPMGVWTSSEQ